LLIDLSKVNQKQLLQYFEIEPNGNS